MPLSTKKKDVVEADAITLGSTYNTHKYHGVLYIPEDFERNQLPAGLAPHKSKCFGLSINPERLAQIRYERRPDSKYASIENCRYEVHEAESMMRRAGIACN